MRLEKRVRTLEARMLADPVVLYFADGSTREICGRADYLLRLFCTACYGGELSPRQASELRSDPRLRGGGAISPTVPFRLVAPALPLSPVPSTSSSSCTPLASSPATSDARPRAA